MMDECVHLKVTIPKSVSMKFRELVNLKHPMYDRGALSYEVEMALRQYIASYTTTHTHANTQESSLQAERSNPNPKVYSFKQEVLKWFLDTQLYLEVPQFIPRTHLESAIAALRGTDKRTIDKWLNDLEKYGCIKKSSPWQYEFV